ncbi:amino acid deaminase/aldolase [Isoptericola halotolerans]|uniref:D-serine deaminase-like pyridoxal phosphate-dependent protein n=1 Tax=Isoptericola halotolerans TaxID=300560 RepID=A0ABX2A3J4_9MICO|nr:alanine racemase [Isoptericola halotolerans]NOV97266.1 D-serine deaminase-like pyridoxal phosphate-dependent protein [Isoptericola halotolerans]
MTVTDRLTRATRGLPAPLAVVDLDMFDANAAGLLRRAGGTPVRVAAKSVRVRSLVERALGAGFAGVMAYSLDEALWLVGTGVRDVLLGYPTVDTGALARLAADPEARREITLMVDDVAQLALVQAALAGPGGGPEVAVCLDVDSSLRLGVLHLGTRRSPLRAPEQVAALAARVAGTDGLRLRGLMFYEAQVAGLPDTPAVRVVKALSVPDVDRRRRRILAAVRTAVRQDVELVNAGGTGSLETSAAGAGVTEVTSGSGLFVPGTFDGMRSVTQRPAAFFGLDVVRTPGPGWATAFGGGYVASGPAGPSRLPRLVTPGWSLTRREATGEVQTPLRRRREGRPLQVGDRVWFRHAKAGELMERFAAVLLVRGDEVVDTVPTYRGEGRTFG